MTEEIVAYSREQWRKRYGITKCTHNNMRKNGTAPRETVIGNSVRILLRDEQEWLERTVAESDQRVAELNRIATEGGRKAAQHPNHPANSAVPARAGRAA
ncbi:MAG: hypothetical protein QM744_14375 [Mesorhizobium sp.]